MVRGDFLIFSSKRSFLLRKRMMDVSVNHLLLQIESKSFKLSCIRFCRGKKQIFTNKVNLCLLKNIIISIEKNDYGGLVFMKHLIVFGHGHAKDDGRDVLKAMDPLLPLGTLTSDVEQSGG